MARNFYEGSFFPFDPQVDWGGRTGYLEAEFPLVPALIAILYQADSGSTRPRAASSSLPSRWGSSGRHTGSR